MFACIYICTLHLYLLSYKRQKMVPNVLQLELQLVLGTELGSSAGIANAEPFLQPLLLSFLPLPHVLSTFYGLQGNGGNICITEIWITNITSLSQKLDACDLH